MLVDGVAFKKTFSYAGFEMQPKKYASPKIALLNIELELKAEKDNAEIRVDTVEVSSEKALKRHTNVANMAFLTPEERIHDPLIKNTTNYACSSCSFIISNNITSL